MNRHAITRSFRTAAAWAATAAVTFTCFAAPPAAADDAPSAAGWEALPAETVFAFRMPHTQAFLENLRANTVAGQRIFTAEKFEQVKSLIEENNQEDWDEMVAGLAEYGFTLDDLLTIAQNNWGMGIVASPRDDQALPRILMLGWAEIDDADIDRVYAALDKAQEEEGLDEGDRRLDYELAGLDVRQYSSGEMGMDREVSWDLPDNFETMTEEQMEAHWADVEKMNAEAEFVKVDETHLLLTRMPGRLVMAIGFPQSKDAVREQLAGGDIDWDIATDVAAVQDVLGRYLAALDGGADDSFAARVLAVPGAAEAVSSDETLFELYADGPGLIELIGAAVATDQSEQDAQQFRTVMDSLGFNGLGVIASSAHLFDGAMRFDLFSQMTAPRAGLLGTLDGQTLPAAPPAWVPAAASYFHLAYDLGKLYDVILQTAQQLGGPEVMQQVQMGNMMVQAQVQADIRTILSSLGTRHTIIATESQQITAEVEEYDADTQTFKTVERTTTVQPAAFVWDLADAEVWNRVMTVMKNFAPMAGGEVELADEQGFTGLRADLEGTPMGVMLGQGKLVVGVGPDVTTRALSSINNPPAGEDSLLGSTLYREGDALLNYREGIFFGIQNAGIDLVNAKNQLVQAMDNEASPSEQALTEQIKALLPNDEDLKASLGVSVGQIIMTEDGLVYEAAAAMPAE